MRAKLKDIASIQTGIFATPTANGDFVYLQTKHFDENGQLKTTLHPDLNAEQISEKHILRPGDVLFSAKGTKNFAAWYESKNPAAVASTSFFVIRVFDNFSDTILPEYLVWSINHPTSQKFLKGQALGTAIASISKAVLEELEMLVPPIETQKTVLQITHLRNREKLLKQKIEALREQQIKQQILNAIK